jgi:hypothetical protein
MKKVYGKLEYKFALDMEVLVYFLKDSIIQYAK